MTENLEEYMDDDDRFLDEEETKTYSQVDDEIAQFMEDTDDVIEEELVVPDKVLTEVDLPKIVQEWEKVALSVSHDNDIPAQVSFFVLLGQIMKDFIRIPNGPNTEDSRIHFCWIQTSGTGKSTLWNFVGPITKDLYKKINTIEGRSLDDPHFNIFDVIEYTDAALIGFYEKQFDEDGEIEWVRHAGALEGSGLAHWDEFEYSGVFKQSQHKENIIVYLNTLMNTLEGESWIITKKLKEGGVMECRCERSVFATTYPPKKLSQLIADKGVLQRMLCYIKHVPEYEQHEMRKKQLKLAGKRTTISVDSERFSNALFEIYRDMQRHYLECGADPFETLKYSDDFADSLYLYYSQMREYIKTCAPEVRETAQNFMTRMLKILMKLSALCCVASSLEVKNPKHRYIVTKTHVIQAHKLTRKCYGTLVDWLELALRTKRKTLSEQVEEASHLNAFIKAYKDMEKGQDGFVSKTALFNKVKEGGISQASVYRYWKNTVNEKFIEEKKQIKLKEDDEK